MDAQLDYGKYLKAERELRRIPLGEVADATRIPLRTLEDLELGKWDCLPAGVFVKGFVRSYARYVGLPESEALGRYDRTLVDAADEQTVLQTEEVGDAASEVSMRRQFGLALFVIILLIIVTITFSLLWGSGTNANFHASLDSINSAVRNYFG